MTKHNGVSVSDTEFYHMRRIAFLLTVVVVVLAGCGADDTPTKPRPRTNVGKIELQETTVAGLEKRIAENKGKVVMIDVWFLGCAPCVKKFPHFVDLHDSYAKEGLVCISLDVYGEELKESGKVLEFLKKQDADTINLIFKDDDKTIDAWQEGNDAVSTPAYVVFDRKGNRRSVPNPAKPKDVEAFVKKLLDEK